MLPPHLDACLGSVSPTEDFFIFDVGSYLSSVYLTELSFSFQVYSTFPKKI